MAANGSTQQQSVAVTWSLSPAGNATASGTAKSKAGLEIVNLKWGPGINVIWLRKVAGVFGFQDMLTKVNTVK